jgi:hypothetical protein
VGGARSTSLPDPTFLEAAAKAGWLDLVRNHVSQEEAHFIMQTSDGLLLIQPHSTLQVPGKLYEYLQLGRPILAFVPPESSIERILQRSGVPYQCAYSSDTPDALDGSVLRFFGLPSTSAIPSEWFENEFNVERHAAALARLIDKLHYSDH